MAVMFGGDGDCVEEHQHDDEPVEPLGLDGVPDPEAQPLLGPPEALAATGCFHFGLEEAC